MKVYLATIDIDGIDAFLDAYELHLGGPVRWSRDAKGVYFEVYDADWTTLAKVILSGSQ